MYLETPNPIPSWLCFLCGFIYFAYQVLDNADGKQARRLGCSSPLGLVLDHGCDALSTVLITSNCLAIFRFDLSTELHLICISIGFPMLMFFFGTWEEYHTGILQLGVVNGANEGVLAVIALHVLDGIFPGLGHRYRLQFVWGSGTFVVLTIVFNFLTVFRSKQVKGKILQTIFSVLPFLVCLSLGLYWIANSRSGIYVKYPQQCIWLLGLSFSKLVTHLQVAHVSNEDFNPWRKTFTIPLALIIINSYYPLAEEGQLLTVSLAVSAMSWLHLIVTVTLQMMRVLRIPLLTVKQK
jgi:ethanolaminephosphotransferase